MVRHVVISAALFALEVVLGLGLLGMGIGLMMMLVALVSAVGSRGRRRHHFGVAVIYALLASQRWVLSSRTGELLRTGQFR